MMLISLKKYLLVFLLLHLYLVASARQRILVDKLASGPFPLEWNTINNYNIKGKAYYLVLEHNRAYAYADQDKYLPPLPFKLPQPRDFNFEGSPTWKKVSNGYLVGYDNGEWGGSLYWFSSDGKENYKISGDQVQSFVLRNKELLALTDGSHQGMPLGRLSKLFIKNGKWTTESYLRLNTILHSITAHGNDLFIVAHQGILRIDAQDSIHHLLNKPIWGSTSIYNTSVILSKNQLYMGMWEGVYRIT
jgi:hypothetical protein